MEGVEDGRQCIGTQTLYLDICYLSRVEVKLSTGKMQESSPNHPTGLADVAFPVERSSYYHFWQAEHSAILTHKWYLSEQAGRDVGESYAGWNWITKGHRARWMAARASGLA